MWLSHLRLSCSMAFTQLDWFLSRETPSTSNPLASLNLASEYFSYAATTFGFSRRQGPHHDAQKSISTMSPRKSESLITLPSGLLKASSGAVSPMFRPTFPEGDTSLFCANTSVLSIENPVRRKAIENKVESENKFFMTFNFRSNLVVD